MIVSICGFSKIEEYDAFIENEIEILLKKVFKGAEVTFFFSGYDKFEKIALGRIKDYRRLFRKCKTHFVFAYHTRHYLEIVNRSNFDKMAMLNFNDNSLEEAIEKCNDWMFEKSDIIITYAREEKVLKKAKEQNKIIYNITESFK